MRNIHDIQLYASRLWPFGGQDAAVSDFAGPDVLGQNVFGWNGPDHCIGLDKADYVVFDTELTGLDRKRDCIVSLGAVRMKGGRLRLGDHFYRVASPRAAMNGKSVVIHGITPTEAAKCPPIESILPEFLDFCRGAVMVGHFVSIDMHFLSAEIRRHTGVTFSVPLVDTASLYRWRRARSEDGCAFYESGEGGLDLASVAKAMRIEGWGSHHALGDAYVTAQVLQRFLCELPGMGVKTLGELLRIGRA